MTGIRTCRALLAAALLSAACSSSHPRPVGLQVDGVERAAITERASRGRVRPLEPPAAPDTRSPATSRPAPQRTVRPPVRASQPLARATNSAASGCTGRMSRDQAHACWDRLLAAYPWPTATAFRVLYCESTGDPNAANGRYHGLMQVDGASFDPVANIAAAFGFWQKRGWEPWACA